MTKLTHTQIGALTGLVLALHFDQQPVVAFALMTVTSMAAVAPDLDIRIGLKHRGITHTVIALVLVWLVALWLLPSPLEWFIAAGYASHLVADMLTVTGIPLLWPLPVKVRLAMLRTGGAIDALIGAGAGISCLVLLWQVLK